MNRPLITAGAPQDPNLPVDRMTEPELREMQQILTTHGAVREQLAMLEQRLSLFLLTARDRRGHAGRIQVDPETGAITVGGGDNGHD